VSERKALALKAMLANGWHGAADENELKKSHCLCCKTWIWLF